MKRKWISIGVVLMIFISSLFSIKTSEGIKFSIPRFSNATHAELADKKWSGDPHNRKIIVNQNQPDFKSSELSLKKDHWIKLSSLDWLGRSGKADALISKEGLPHQKRLRIIQTKPSGWVQEKVNGEFIFNRSHLIGYQLSGINDDPRNLMTGTRGLNAGYNPNDDSMLTYENKIANYVKSTGHHVRYRVQPIFKKGERLARGVLMEGQSVEDNRIRFNVYLFNVQSGVKLDYLRGGIASSAGGAS